jgi:hypothetical protein
LTINRAFAAHTDGATPPHQNPHYSLLSTTPRLCSTCSNAPQCDCGAAIVPLVDGVVHGGGVFATTHSSYPCSAGGDEVAMLSAPDPEAWASWVRLPTVWTRCSEIGERRRDSKLVTLMKSGASAWSRYARRQESGARARSLPFPSCRPYTRYDGSEAWGQSVASDAAVLMDVVLLVVDMGQWRCAAGGS